MKLLIHVGTEKTGSSYLQKLCAKNRQSLKECGYWFPRAGRIDEEMLQTWTISPGNAGDLARHVESGDWSTVSSWLESRVREAGANDCHRLLLSHELIFAALSHQGVIEQFEQSAAKAGIDDIDCLLMIRDPVDHALSLYKHRAKGGTTVSIEEWITKGYPLPQQLAGFLNEIDCSAVRLSLRKYEKAKGSIESAFFQDWLKIDTPPNRIESLVNPSLTLSELAVIQHVVATRPRDHHAFYSSFQAVSVVKKANDGSVEQLATAHLENYLCQFNKFWKELDARLVSDGGLNVPRKDTFDDVGVPKYTFSDAQIRAWMDAHVESSSCRYFVHWWVISRLRPLIGKLIRVLVPRFRQE